jgi:serine/threonine protein kinase
MSDDMDYTALAGILGETISPEPPRDGTSAEMPGKSGTALRYFGDYLLEEEIARGGMGVVYRARQLTLNRTVAVKVLRDTAFAGGEEVERFKVEAGAAAALRHPNIVGIHEIGEHGGTHFFSMDYVPGLTLARVLRDGPVPAHKAANLMVKIAQALQHAHSQGVLHRDLKPANVLLDEAGQPVVTDFGLAKHDAADLGLTLSGQVLGTPAYMAPEQAEGRMKDCGPHTDVYGLGALLYHLTSGRAPFTGDSHLAVITQVTHDEPVSVRLLNPSIPRDLETICAKAMAKEIPRRYHSAQEMADDVQRFLDGKPVHARPLGTVGKTWRWARRHRVLAASLTIAALSLTAVAVLETLSAQRLKTSRDAEAKARRAAEALIKDMLVDMRDKLRPLNKVALLSDAAASAERYFDQLPQPLSAATEQQRAVMLEARSDVLLAQADLPGALEKQRLSQDVLERLLRDDPHSRDLLRDTSHAAESLAWLYKRQGHNGDALPMLNRAQVLLAALAAESPDNTSVRHASQLAACSYAEALIRAGKKEDGAKILTPLLAAGEAQGAGDGSWKALDRAAELHIHLGDTLWYSQRNAEAHTTYQKAHAFAEKAHELQPDLTSQRRLITALERVTDTFVEVKDFTAARDRAARRLAISQAVAAADPANLAHRADVAAAHGRLSMVAVMMKDPDAGLVSARKARAIYEDLAVRDPGNFPHRSVIVTLWMDEAMLLKDTDEAAAVAAYGKSIESCEALIRDDPKNPEWQRHLVVSHLNVSNLHLYHHRLPEARRHIESAATVNAALRRDYPGVAQYERDGTKIESMQKQIEEAE